MAARFGTSFGYLWLAANLAGDANVVPANREQLCSAFNFGPQLSSNRTVADVVAAILARTGGEWDDQSDPNAPHEASKLNLAIDKAYHLLNWEPTWDFEKTIDATVQWYAEVRSSVNAISATSQQIDLYTEFAREKQLSWAAG